MSYFNVESVFFPSFLAYSLFLLCRPAPYCWRSFLSTTFSSYLLLPSSQTYVRTVFTWTVTQRSAVSVTVRLAHVSHGLSSSEWGEYNGGGSGWSLGLFHAWKGELVYKFYIFRYLTGRKRHWCWCFFQLPMVLKVPRLNFSPLALCDRPFSILGFGDILVPGNQLCPYKMRKWNCWRLII